MKQVNSVRQVKENNLSLIKNVIRTSGAVTKNFVSQETGLSIATSNNLLNTLVESGEILTVGSEKSIGRPAMSYIYNKDYAHICTIFPSSVGDQRYLYYAVLDLLGNALDQRQIPLERVDYEAFETQIGALLEKYPKISTFSIGIPAYFDDEYIHTCTLHELNGVDLVGRLRTRFSCHFHMENNMNAIAYGLYTEEKGGRGGGEFSSLAVLAYFKEGGTGCGIILNGEILRGQTGFAGEVGFLPYDGNGTLADLAAGTPEEMLTSAAFAVCGLTAVINPAVCALTGENIAPDMCDKIRTRCKQYIPEPHMPKIEYMKDYNRYYQTGLFQLVMELELY